MTEREYNEACERTTCPVGPSSEESFGTNPSCACGSDVIPGHKLCPKCEELTKRGEL